MEKKIQNQFIDHGCGFSIILRHVPMIKIEGKWIPSLRQAEAAKKSGSKLPYSKAAAPPFRLRASLRLNFATGKIII